MPTENEVTRKLRAILSADVKGYSLLMADNETFTVDVCGTTANVIVFMRAVELEGGTTLATDHTIMPMKTVVPNEVEDEGITEYFTYTIALEQVSVNNT